MSALNPLRNFTLIAGLLLAGILLVVLVASFVRPPSPADIVGSTFDALQHRLIIERRMRFECAGGRLPFMIQLQRLHYVAARGRLAEPPPDQTRSLEVIARQLSQAAEDGVIDARECGEFISTSSDMLPLDIR